MRTVIIGSGNTATVLGKKITEAGHEVVEVCGRNKAAVAELAGILKSRPTIGFNDITPNADLYILAIADDAIPALSGSLQLEKKLVVHTAGSVSMEILKSYSRNYGILYPLQSLRKEMETVPEMPFLINANTADNLAIIAEFANSLSQRVQTASDEQRLKIHLAAVMVSNFTNHLYALAHEYCKNEKLDFAMLLPLISSIAERIRDFDPAAVQTGPAVRHDTRTIDKHLKLLDEHPQLKEFYSLFTKSIEKMYP